MHGVIMLLICILRNYFRPVNRLGSSAAAVTELCLAIKEFEATSCISIVKAMLPHGVGLHLMARCGKFQKLLSKFWNSWWKFPVFF